jgi:hypothetical protein
MIAASDDRPNEDGVPLDAPAAADRPAEAPPPERGAEGVPQAPRRRRRRRRRKPPGTTAPPPVAGANDAAAPRRQEGEAPSRERLTIKRSPPPPAAPPGAAPANRPPRSRGRRRRPPRFRPGEPRPGTDAAAAAAQTGADPAPAEARQDAPRPRQGQRPGDRRGFKPRVSEDRSGEGGGRGPRERGKARPGRGKPGGRNRPFGGDRGGPPKRPERVLVSLESTVDRGFEDVPDEANEGGTRRVTWTIVKRTVADQKTTRPVSAVYVLQRDGVDTEFANLGAARAAVNKTIVHPEKLTRAKAEYAAAKKK